MYKNQRIAAVIPAYNEANHLAAVTAGLPAAVDHVVVVNDGSRDRTLQVAELLAESDARLIVISHETNRGVGAARVTGILRALEIPGVDIIVNLDGDDQMDTEHLTALLDPLVAGTCEYAKGNRFFSATSFEGMPLARLAGNVVFTFFTKASTGYWSIFDPQNGFTAMTVETARRLDLPTLAADYSYENDVICRLSILRARIRDVDIPARYGTETSSIRPFQAVASISRLLVAAAWRRFWLTYVVRSFSPVALFVIAGVPLTLFSFGFGTWAVVNAIGPSQVSAANAALTSLTFTVGFMLLLAALVIDILNEPR